jgi:hypothetical protein
MDDTLFEIPLGVGTAVGKSAVHSPQHSSWVWSRSGQINKSTQPAHDWSLQREAPAEIEAAKQKCELTTEEGGRKP